MKAHDVKASELCKGMTMQIRVTGMKVFSMRFFIVMQLLRLVALVSPVNVEVETKP